MYLINKEENRISQLQEKTFSGLKFRERENLQEWIAKSPESLGEELLIIQKEFNGFSETNERLDLLALDKSGNLVVIENKLDDSGKDVTWQGIKYASYCAGLTKHQIIEIYQKYLGSSANAEENLTDFFNVADASELQLNQGLNSQRLILVAAKFRPEVTSSVLWLLNFKIRIQCFKVTPFAFDDKLLLNFEQILPTKDAQDFSVNIASKALEENETQETLRNRHEIRLRFWEALIDASKIGKGQFSNNSPSKDNWIGKGIGLTRVNLNLVVSGKNCRGEVFFNRGNKEENKRLFDFMYEMKEEIESNYGGKLDWQRKDENVTSRIQYSLTDVSYFEESDWPKMIEFMLDSAWRLEKAIEGPMKKLKKFANEQ